MVATYLLQLALVHKDLLASIRHWNDLKIAFDSQSVWVKDFTAEQWQSTDLQGIPFKECFEVKDNLLFAKGHLVPSKKMPSGLLWSPIVRGLAVEIPASNHNYFGIHQKINIQIVASDKEREAFALLTDYDTAKAYLLTAPAVRVAGLQWVVINEQILLIGCPLLPIKGQSYWASNGSLLPSGFDFEFAILSKTIQKKLNPNQEQYLIWSATGSYYAVDKNDLQDLSLSSFRLTFS